MKNKRTVLIIFSIIILIILGCSIIYFVNRNKPSEKEIVLDENTQLVKSTATDKIEKDGLEAVDIKIVKESTESLIVTTTLKNNSNTPVEHVYLEVYLLNNDGKVVTSFAIDHKEKLDPNSSASIESYIAGDDADIKSITKAEINRIEKY